MVILGLDPASIRNLGWALFKYEGDLQNLVVEAGTIVMETVNEPHECLWPLLQAVDNFLSENKPDKLIIEKTSSFSGGFITGQVSNCMGVILAIAGKHKLPIEFVYPTHVKKVLTDKGKATKSELKKSVIGILCKILKKKMLSN